MYDDFFRGLSWLTERGWVGPAIGLCAFGLAFWAGRYLLAARPARPAPRGETAATLFEAHQKLTRERRSAPRRRVGCTVEVFLDGGQGDEPAKGWVFDRSIGGLGVRAEGPVEVGTLLKVRARRAAETTPWVQVVVRSCKRGDGHYDLGCQFQRVPDWNVILQFG
jgi:PilZ domain